MEGNKGLAWMFGDLVGSRPYAIIVLIILLSALAQYGNSMLKQKVEDNSDMIPDTYDEISSLNKISDEFGGVKSGNMVVEIEPVVGGSNEVRDVREPKVMEYVRLLAENAALVESVESAASAADMVEVEGRIPHSIQSIKDALAKNPQSQTYVSSDYTMTLVKLSLMPDAVDEEVYDDMTRVVESTPAPAGVKASLSGDFATSTSMHRTLSPDMARTSMFSMVGILFIIIMMFRSLRYGLTSLTAIIFGVTWTFGLMGLLGWEVTNVTSGGASMIMGIGIDFGIQIVSRFRIELRKLKIREAMAETVRVVAMPMGTTTIAALIGFQAMSMGELKVLSDLGRMMSIGVLCCMIAALTVVTSALVLGEKYLGKKEEK